MNLRTETRCFSDVFLHSQAIASWSQRYDQISPGLANTSLRQITGQRFQVFRERMNQRVMQHGFAPRNRLCFALPVVHAVAPVVQGRAVSCPSLLTLRGGDEFVAHLPCDTDVIAFTFERSLVTEREQAAFADLPERILTQPVLPVPSERYRAAVSGLEQLLHQALDAESLTQRDAFDEKVLAHGIVGILLDLLQPDDSEQRALPPMSTQSYIVRKSQELALGSDDDVLTVLDLCHHLKISRRTLQYSFQNVVGTTPTAYLRSIRLNAVRRFLMATPASVRIGDAAAQYGFSHFGRFSYYYQQHFHELPSQTRRSR
ncbi:helix-turn-helix domain-containing protein [Trinickia caryophylli]|uniref:Transcriptional regulator, AraC family n=1 Tax=Trinickia caryophylli TaxID=28094 RepID=A0A1X7E897_TRICW|nr:helix-turn-helix domain-containing protein [Trinickia caryophylli]PMS13036.1 AraC family transcriptional regulator [Trinickia caryophylli]TRX14798.1 helix-turn-helix domain-containing protein [Trinickia caryophylli]WQE14644.1 helix-turn-helix domain-containing protein [Trinickia caryophylli]SMF29397.1 transcriptional regulator, AraC family [Trinickia caryophylli]GLU31936.1 AraC family transcriptional regulator [Trinickia caryophylli]